MVKVSIIVPVYNVEKYLERCMKSLLGQSLQDIEIILVDDGSKDNCPQLCDEYAKMDRRIKVVHKNNEGLGFARNTGLKIATGEYVTFLDSDDYVEPETYEVIYNKAIECNLDICYFKNRRFLLDGSRQELFFNSKEYYFQGKEKVSQFLLAMVGDDPTCKMRGNFSMSVCMAIFKLSVIKESGVIFPSERSVASEDLLFHVRFLPFVSNVAVLPNVYYNYFINPESITTTFNDAKYERMIRLLELVKAELLQNYTWLQVKNHYYSQILRVMRVVFKFESKSKKSPRERIRRIKEHCCETLFEEMYRDTIIRKYPLQTQVIVICMKYRLAYILMIMYRYFKK